MSDAVDKFLDALDESQLFRESIKLAHKKLLEERKFCGGVPSAGEYVRQAEAGVRSAEQAYEESKQWLKKALAGLLLEVAREDAP